MANVTWNDGRDAATVRRGRNRKTGATWYHVRHAFKLSGSAATAFVADYWTQDIDDTLSRLMF